MKALVVDDEPPARRRMARLLAELGVEFIEAADGHEALAVLDEVTPDVMLLDVRMPGLDGISLASTKRALPPIVFVTAHADFAVQAFELAATDYLLKPVRLERLSAALQRVKQREPPQPSSELAPIRVSSVERGSLRVFDARAIARFRASDKYTLFMSEGAEHVSAESLNTLEQRLAPHGFVRVHRSELINLAHVRALSEDHELELDDGERVPVSRRSLPGLRERLRQLGRG